MEFFAAFFHGGEGGGGGVDGGVEDYFDAETEGVFEEGDGAGDAVGEY